MIERVQFSNFKALKDVNVKLERLTMLVGPNACGKTSVLQGLLYLAQLRDTDPIEVFKRVYDPQSLFSGGTTNPVELKVFGQAGQTKAPEQADQTKWSLSTTIHQQRKDRGVALSFEVRRNWGAKEAVYESRHPLPYSQWSKNGTEALDSAFPAGVILHLSARRLVEPCPADANARVHSDGFGVAEVLSNMQGYEPERFAAVQTALRAVIPSVKGIRLKPIEIPHIESVPDGKTGTRYIETRRPSHRLLFDMERTGTVPADAVSEGMLLVLGLLTVINEPEHPRLLLIDDLEHGLHPRAHGPLLEQLRELLKREPELQLVTTSHSPYLLDQLQYEEIRLITPDEDGFAVCGSLQEHPDFSRWRELMGPGEFWSMYAEDWLKGKGKKA